MCAAIDASSTTTVPSPIRPSNASSTSAGPLTFTSRIERASASDGDSPAVSTNASRWSTMPARAASDAGSVMSQVTWPPTRSATSVSPGSSSATASPMPDAPPITTFIPISSDDVASERRRTVDHLRDLDSDPLPLLALERDADRPGVSPSAPGP